MWGVKMNNFEKIKAMSIEEMEEFISNVCQINMNIACSDSLCGDIHCLEHLKQWLESEVEE